MRREKDTDIKKHYSYSVFKPWLFWHTCKQCNFEIKNEKMHRITWSMRSVPGSALSVNIPIGEVYKFCFECFKTKEDVISHCEAERLPRYGL